MRIEHASVTPIALGDPPLLNASGLHAPFALRIVLEIVTEDGRSGWSEVPGDADLLHDLEATAARVRGLSVHAAPRVDLGEPATDSRGAQSWDARRTVHVQSALDVACLDVIARRLECRVADLLGGVNRTRVPFAGYLFYKFAGAGGDFGFELDNRAAGWPAVRQLAALDADGLVAQARAMVDAFGFASLKVKGGWFPPDEEVTAVLALREDFGPGMVLRLDPNAVWRYETARHAGQRLRGVVEYLEDPVRGQDAMARLRNEIGIPLATNMCTTGFADLPSSLALGSEDIILGDHHFWGGLRPSMVLAAICGTFGRGMSIHSNSHAGISMAAMVQLGAALPALHSSLDTHYPWQDDDILAGGPWQLTDGCASLPDAPGLGVDVDRQALAAAHARYLACGLTRRDDAAAMRRVDPEWRFEATRY